jgi:hypothetical protein
MSNPADEEREVVAFCNSRDKGSIATQSSAICKKTRHSYGAW